MGEEGHSGENQEQDDGGEYVRRLEGKAQKPERDAVANEHHKESLPLERPGGNGLIGIRAYPEGRPVETLFLRDGEMDTGLPRRFDCRRLTADANSDEFQIA